MLALSRATIYTRISREPHRLPERREFPDGDKGFLLSDVLAWLHQSHQSLSVEIETEVEPRKKRRGRRRKTNPESEK